MMRKIQKKRKSSTEKEAASENTSAEEENEKVDSDETHKADSNSVLEEEIDVWDHFARLNEGEAQCELCEKKLNYGTSIAVLKGHLKSKHPSLQDRKSETVEGNTGGGNLDEQVENNNPVEGEGMGRRRAGVWGHFVRLNKALAQCKVCKRDLNYSASISNLKRHLRLKHPQEHTQLMSPKVSFSWQKKEKEKNSPEKERKRKRKGKLSDVDISESMDENEIQNSDSEYQPETDDSDNQMNSKGRKVKNVKRQKQDVWASFEKVDHDTASCMLCGKGIKFKPCLTSLKRHLEKQHSVPTNADRHEEDESDDNSFENDESDSQLFRRRKSDLWTHFVTLSKEIARCRHCRKNLNYRSSATNLKRHLRVMHPNAHAQLGKAKSTEKEASSKKSTPSKTSRKGSVSQKNRNEKPPVKKKMAFSNREESDEDSSVDNETPASMHDGSDEDSGDENEMPRVGNSSETSKQRRVRSSEDAFSRISSAEKHNRKHTPSVPKPKKVHAKRKRSRLWDFFTVLDEKFAECNTCKHKLVHKSGLSNLAKHYTMKHSVANTTSTTQAGMSEMDMAINSLNDGEVPVPSESQPNQTLSEPEPKRKTRKRNSENHWRCAIWRLFEKQDETFSQCKSCLKRISHRSTNANLLKHTRIKHPDIYFKFEERLKDFSHNVNVLVDHFFPESLITASTSGNSASQASQDADHLPQQEYHMSENPAPQMYDNMQSYSFPVIFVQEEEAAAAAAHSTNETIAATSVITSAPPLNPASYTMGGHTVIATGDHSHPTNPTIHSNPHLPSHDPHLPAHIAEHPRVGHPPPAYMGEPVAHGNSAHSVVAHSNAHSVAHSNPQVPVPYPPPGSFGGNYSQVLTTSFNVSSGGTVAQSNDRLIGMVEESNQLLRGMQSAIERQSDVLIRLAESIATGMRAS